MNANFSKDKPTFRITGDLFLSPVHYGILKGMHYENRIRQGLSSNHPNQKEFQQAADSVLSTLAPILRKDGRYEKYRVLERLLEPERQIQFRVTWLDDAGDIHVNRAYRVEFSSVLGPYKGGLRFHPTVNPSVMKFLGFEQIFKNALTGLMLGAGKGGADFNPKGRSEAEIMRFCQSFMTELNRHIGPHTDVPAGDIGVGSREVGYLFGQYRHLTGRFEGAMTGKGTEWGGSYLRTEATGYGAVYFAQAMLETAGESLEGKTCAVSGAGNVALHTIEKLQQLGAKPVTASDSTGTLYDNHGIDLETLRPLKDNTNLSLADYTKEHPGAEFIPRAAYPAGKHPVWSFPVDAAFPCATQNELFATDADALIKNGVGLICEGANMPCTPEAVKRFIHAGIPYAPGKAANAGGVAVSQLEMQQNASMAQWPIEKVDAKLREIMQRIFTVSSEMAKECKKPGNLEVGANVAGFKRVADAMIAQGAV